MSMEVSLTAQSGPLMFLHTLKKLPSLPWPLGHVRLISFLGLVCAALLFFSTC